MNMKRILSIALVLGALAAILPVSGYAADDAKANDWTIYLRPAIRFGTDDRTLFILDILAPVYRGDKDILFLNAKFTPDDHDAWETNAGIGYRRLLADDRLILGGNFFYDHRKTARGNNFDQLGLGVEAMGELKGIGLTTRINYYQPLTGTKLGEGFAYEFFGNGIYGAGVEEPMTGFDYEAGVRIPWVSNYVETWAYAGGYHFFGSHVDNVNGFSSRLEVIPTDFVRLNFEYRNDNIDHDQYYGEVAFEVPFSIESLVAGKNPFTGLGSRIGGSRTLPERLVEPVRRDVDIVVKEGALSPEEAAANGDMVAGAIFVADNAPGGGDGSFEHPYNSLWTAAGDPRLGNGIDIVHVLRGDGSGMGCGGGLHSLTSPASPSGAPARQTPPTRTSSTSFRAIRVLFSGIVMNGPNQTILGLYFDEPANSGITIGSGASGAGLSIFSNIIDNPENNGIDYGNPGDLGAPGAPARIWGNTITNVGDSSFSTAGIYLNSYIGSVYANVYNNLIEDVWNEGSASGIFVAAGDGSFNGSITGNTISYIGAGYEAAGINVYADGDFNGVISGNRIFDIEAFDNDEVYAYGIHAEAGENFNGSISNNEIGGVWAGEAYWAEANGIYAAAEDGNFNGAINDNTVSEVWAEYTADGVQANGIAVDAGGNLNVSIAGNVVDDIWAGDTGGDAEANGIYAWADMGLAGSIHDNTVSSIFAGDADGDVFALGIGGESDSGVFSGDIYGNTVTGVSAEDCSGDAFAAGLGINPYGWWWEEDGGTVTGSIHNNTVSEIFADYADDSTYALGIVGWSGYDNDYLGSVSNNSVSGVYSNDWSDGISIWGRDVSGAISGNTVGGVVSDNDNAYGIEAHAFYDLTSSISGNTISGVNGDYLGCGIYAGGDGVVAGVIDNNTITGITSAYDVEGVYLWGYMSGIFTSVTNNIMEVSSPNSAYGLYVDISYPDAGATLGNATAPMVFTGNSGTINAANAYVAYLNVFNPAASNVFIGFGQYGMGDNDFTTTGAWGGNFPSDGGPIWANGYPGINFIHW